MEICNISCLERNLHTVHRSCYYITRVLFGISKSFQLLYFRRVHRCCVQSFGEITWEEFEKVGLNHLEKKHFSPGVTYIPSLVSFGVCSVSRRSENPKAQFEKVKKKKKEN